MVVWSVELWSTKSVKKKQNPWLQLIGIDLAFPRSQVLNGSYELKFLSYWVHYKASK